MITKPASDQCLDELKNIHMDSTLENGAETLEKQILVILREFARDVISSGKPCPACGCSGKH